MDQDGNSFYSPFGKYSSSRDGNELRPYYREALRDSTYSSAGPSAASMPSRRHGDSGGRDFRDMFSDIDYGDYLPHSSPSTTDLAKRILDEAMWNYTSCVLSQPFEVARIVLQCYDAGAKESGGLNEGSFNGRRPLHQNMQTYSDSESDEDTPSYFVPTSPDETPSRRPARRNPLSRSQSHHSQPKATTTEPPMLALSNPDSILEVISQIWGKEGVFGVWKGTNSTFVYGVLLRTIETWLRSCFSALLDLPDPGLFQSGIRLQSVGSPGILDSPNPALSVAVVVLAAGMAGLILSPIDMVRTRLILTPVTRGPRALIPSLRALPGFACPQKLIPITLVHSTLPSLVTASTRLLLKSWLRIDAVLTPASFSVSSFFIAIGDLFIRLPLETVLRRGHVAVLASAATQESSKTAASILPLHGNISNQRFRTIVPIGPYKGIVGSIYHIIYEEGRRIPAALPPPSTPSTRGKPVDSRLMKPRRGQGAAGLWRGYKVGLAGVFGAWTALGIGGQAGGEF